jgi:hypothetical protein
MFQMISSWPPRAHRNTAVRIKAKVFRRYGSSTCVLATGRSIAGQGDRFGAYPVVRLARTESGC